MEDYERRRTTLKNDSDEFPLNQAEEEFLRVCSMGEFTGSRPVISRRQTENGTKQKDDKI